MGDHFLENSTAVNTNFKYFWSTQVVKRQPCARLWRIRFWCKCLLLIAIENGDSWAFMAAEGETQFYHPIEEIKGRPECACMFKYPEPIGNLSSFCFDISFITYSLKRIGFYKIWPPSSYFTLNFLENQLKHMVTSISTVINLEMDK